jgi:hypothetical protein
LEKVYLLSTAPALLVITPTKAEKIMENKLKCHCCSYFTVDGISSICPVCFWQEDTYQEAHVDDDGGPNMVSLREAKRNYENVGAVEKRFIKDVRPPHKDELR